MICSFCLIDSSNMNLQTKIIEVNDNQRICSECLKECNKLLRKQEANKVIDFNFHAAHRRKLEIE